MNERIIKAGISQGDTNGTSYEMILKMFDNTHIFETCIPIVYGSSKILAYHRKVLDLQSVNVSNINRAEDAGSNRLNMINVVSEDLLVELGNPTPASAQAADIALVRALDDLKAGTIDVLIAAPSEIDPAPVAELKTAHEKKSLKIVTNDSFRLALATGNVPLAEVPSLLTADSLTGKIIALRDSLIRDFQVTLPRIAVLALNPAGKEENITSAAVQAASNAGVQCFGPYAADDFFASDRHRKFDAVLAMYHDQGMIAFKTLTSEDHALFIGNLPHIITAPNLPAAFEKAGKNETSPEALQKALHLAIDIYRNRKTDREINSNPLKKQYFDRGSDNEKLDLTKEDI
ncbi:MAG: 4-hydroxythreonine-4-phosphate dehydrogenase PdxA [Dysgonamonadaceae bacterium]|jgi:4-hydroxythreonine-4-phosphate dehydrogenase|nr:4-hydroxythreonine-4-phosphate dehydrogenase PdxA [Dysgonamonadaceae bacterium]